MRPDLPGAYLQLPTGPVIQLVQASWSGFRKRARVLLLIDTSALESGLDANRVAQSVSAGFKQLAGDDQAGAWALPGASGSALTYVEVIPIQPLRSSATTLEHAIGAVRPSSGHVALYRTLQAAATAMSASLDPTKINAVVLISAGRSSDPADSDRFSALAALSGMASQVPGVHVFTIAYGKNPDRQNLRLVALEGKGASYDASDPTSVSRALAAVISNF